MSERATSIPPEIGHKLSYEDQLRQVVDTLSGENVPTLDNLLQAQALAGVIKAVDPGDGLRYVDGTTGKIIEDGSVIDLANEVKEKADPSQWLMDDESVDAASQIGDAGNIRLKTNQNPGGLTQGQRKAFHDYWGTYHKDISKASAVFDKFKDLARKRVALNEELTDYYDALEAPSTQSVEQTAVEAIPSVTDFSVTTKEHANEPVNSAVKPTPGIMPKKTTLKAGGLHQSNHTVAEPNEQAVPKPKEQVSNEAKAESKSTALETDELELQAESEESTDTDQKAGIKSNSVPRAEKVDYRGSRHRSPNHKRAEKKTQSETNVSQDNVEETTDYVSSDTLENRYPALAQSLKVEEKTDLAKQAEREAAEEVIVGTVLPARASRYAPPSAAEQSMADKLASKRPADFTIKALEQPSENQSTPNPRTHRRATSGVKTVDPTYKPLILETQTVSNMLENKHAYIESNDLAVIPEDTPRAAAEDGLPTSEIIAERVAAGMRVGNARRTGKKNASTEPKTEPISAVSGNEYPEYPQAAADRESADTPEESRSRVKDVFKTIGWSLRHPTAAMGMLMAEAQNQNEYTNAEAGAENQTRRKNLLGLAAGAAVIGGAAFKGYLLYKGMAGGGSLGTAEQAADVAANTGAPAPEVPPAPAPEPPLPTTGQLESAGDTISEDIQDLFEAHGEGDNIAEINEAKNRALAASGLSEQDATRMAIGQTYTHGDYSDLLQQAYQQAAVRTEVPLETQAASTAITPEAVPAEVPPVLTAEQIRQQEIMDAIDPRYYGAAGAIIAAYVGGGLARDRWLEYLAEEDKKKLKKKK